MRPRLTVVTAGQIDHGKSTVLGRLLADSGQCPNGRLEAARARSGFEYAHLLDALKDEQEKGITLDVARVYFRGAERDYQFVDAPGHFEFLGNMVTGAARADAALLVVDAEQGLADNTRRHAALLAMLGIPQVLVLINKMDRVGYQRQRFTLRAAESRSLLSANKLSCAGVLPVCGARGDNITRSSSALSWHAGPTLLEALEALAEPPRAVRASFSHGGAGCF